MKREPGWRAALPILRHANFRNFLIARVATNIGWQMLAVAVGWQVYSMTHDPLALGLVGLCEFLPFFSLILVGGHVADHVNRRRIIITTALVDALCAMTLLWIALAGIARPWPVYVAICAFGTTRAFWAPAMQAFLVNTVPREEFTAAAALDSLLRQSGFVAGPAVGGALYLLGAQVVYASCAGLFIVTVLMMWRMRIQLPVLARNVRPLHERGHELLEGLRHVMRNPVVLGCISLDLFAVLLGGAVALLPIYAADILHTGPVGLGLLRSAPATGAAMVGIWLAFRPLRDRVGAWMFGGVAVFGMATIVFGLSTTFIVSLFALIIAGAGDMISVYIRTVLVQLNTPDSIRGRVSAVNSMFIGASNELGAFESGVMARLIGTVPSVVVGGIATLAVVAAWMRWFPQLRRMPSLQ